MPPNPDNPRLTEFQLSLEIASNTGSLSLIYIPNVSLISDKHETLKLSDRAFCAYGRTEIECVVSFSVYTIAPSKTKSALKQKVSVSLNNIYILFFYFLSSVNNINDYVRSDTRYSDDGVQ